MAIQERQGWKQYPVQVTIGLVVTGQAVFAGYAVAVRAVLGPRSPSERRLVANRAGIGLAGRRSSGYRPSGHKFLESTAYTVR